MFWTSQTLTGLDGTGKQCILHVPGGITRESDGQSGVSCCFPGYLFVIHLYHLQNGVLFRNMACALLPKIMRMACTDKP